MVTIVVPVSKGLATASAIPKRMVRTARTVRQATAAVMACVRVKKIVAIAQ